MLLRVRGAGAERDLDVPIMNPMDAGAGNAFSQKISRCITRGRRGGDLMGGKSRMRKKLRRPFPTNSTGKAGEASSARATRGGRLHAPPCRFHDGSDAGPAARIALLPVPDAESAEVRRPPFPPGGKFPTRPKRVRLACRSIGGGMGERAIGGSGGSNGRQGRRRRRMRMRRTRWADVRMPMRMRGTRRARYLQTLPQPYSYAAYLTQLYSYAAISLRRICLCSYYVGHTATADIFYVDILHCSCTHITYSQRPPHSPHPLLTQS